MGGCCGSEREETYMKLPAQAQEHITEGSKPATKEAKSPSKAKKKTVTVNASAPTSPGRTPEDLHSPEAQKTCRKRVSVIEASGLRRRAKTPKSHQSDKKKSAFQESNSLPTTADEVSGIAIKPLQQSIFDKYKKLSDLYSDKATAIYLTQNRTSHKQRIIKVLRKAAKSSNQIGTKNEAEEQFRREVVTVSNLDHPNILKIFKLYEDKQSFYIVSEPVDGGNLIDYITSTKTLSEVFAAKVMYQVLQVLNYCHKHGVVHRSLQPRSILFLAVAKGEEPVVKVTGFGSAHLLSDQEKLTLSVSSAYYVAPETLKRNYSEKSDVWSLGIILYQLLNGTPPFLGQFVSDIVENVLRKPLSFPQGQWSGVSREAIDLLQSMLMKNPANRASVEDCLRHPLILRYKDEMLATAAPVMHALANLQRFKVNQALKQAVMKFLSDEVQNSEETKELVKTFKAMDQNGDGVLSREELVSAYEKSMPHDRACYTVDQVMKSVDVDNSGVIDFSEFMLASLNSKTILKRSNLLLIFQTFDEDGSGKVSIAEIKEKVRTKDNSISDELWDELVAQVDSNGDEELDFKEFSQLIKLAVS